MSESLRENERILARLEKLEKQNRMWKRGALACLLVFASIGLMGQAKKTPPRKAAPAPAPAPAFTMPENIEAQSFVLKDPNGHPRAELAMSGTGPSLKMLDQGGTALISISLNDNSPGGPFVLLSDPQHHGGLSISVLEKAGPQLTLTGDRADVQAHIAVGPDGTSLALSDQDGFTTNIGSGVQPTKNGQVKKTSAASITLFNKDQKVLWSTP
jgi:hypothetical protein